MSEMVERIARALNPTAWHAIDLAKKQAEKNARECGWDTELAVRHLSAGTDQSILMAMTVLEAMKEPTDEMYDALSATGILWRDNTAKGVWKVMIESALK